MHHCCWLNHHDPILHHQVLDLIASISSWKHQICWLSNAGEGKYYVDVDVCVCTLITYYVSCCIVFLLHCYKYSIKQIIMIYIYIVYYHILYHISYIVSYIYRIYSITCMYIYTYIDIWAFPRSLCGFSSCAKEEGGKLGKRPTKGA
jgi:hypothetical protein